MRCGVAWWRRGREGEPRVVRGGAPVDEVGSTNIVLHLESLAERNGKLGCELSSLGLLVVLSFLSSAKRNNPELSATIDIAMICLIVLESLVASGHFVKSIIDQFSKGFHVL